jgi:hypothetical protein
MRVPIDPIASSGDFEAITFGGVRYETRDAWRSKQRDWQREWGSPLEVAGESPKQRLRHIELQTQETMNDLRAADSRRGYDSNKRAEMLEQSVYRNTRLLRRGIE